MAASGGALTVDVTGSTFVVSVKAQGLKSDGSADGEEIVMEQNGKSFSGTLSGTAITKVRFALECANGEVITNVI